MGTSTVAKTSIGVAAAAILLTAAALAPLPGVQAQGAPPPQGEGAVEEGVPDVTRMVVAVVRGLRSNRGHIRGAIYPSAETFTHEGQGTSTCISSVRGRVSRCVFEDVPPGRYAVGVMHDEDDDEHFDQGFMGIPQEGYGFSRNAHGTMGPPSFEDAAFTFRGGSMLTIELTIRYGI